MKEVKQNKKFTKGFTLLELLVVVLIIGILAAIALPQYRLAVMKSKLATVKNIVRKTVESRQRYYLEHGEYSRNVEDLDINFPYTHKNCYSSECSYSLNSDFLIVLNNGQTYGYFFKDSLRFSYVCSNRSARCTCESYKDSSELINRLCKDDNK